MGRTVIHHLSMDHVPQQAYRELRKGLLKLYENHDYRNVLGSHGTSFDGQISLHLQHTDRTLNEQPIG